MFEETKSRHGDGREEQEGGVAVQEKDKDNDEFSTSGACTGLLSELY
jgi:hypothetical protein